MLCEVSFFTKNLHVVKGRFECRFKGRFRGRFECRSKDRLKFRLKDRFECRLKDKLKDTLERRCHTVEHNSKQRPIRDLGLEFNLHLNLAFDLHSMVICVNSSEDCQSLYHALHESTMAAQDELSTRKNLAAPLISLETTPMEAPSSHFERFRRHHPRPGQKYR